MSSQQGLNGLKTSLPGTHAAINAQQPPSYQHPSQEQQDRFLQSRPGATQQHLEVALQHARQIQSQKDAEDTILNLILDLLELPSAPSADPATPSEEDTNKFKSSLLLFRPSDYDNLILERNYGESCGYALCPRKHRKQRGPRGGFQFKYGPKGSGPGGRGRSVDIVPQDQVEKWCSDACAERALWIKVQLSKEPILERRADHTRGLNILLLEEARAKRLMPPAPTGTVSSVVEGMNNLMLANPDRARELAVERGDTSSIHRDGRVPVTLRENVSGSHASAPQMGPDDMAGGSIEGYVPRGDRGDRAVDHDGVMDILDEL